MILKVYIKNELFHLPRKQKDLTDLIKEKFYKRKKLVKDAFQKMYRIEKIECNQRDLEYDKNLNIFLLNLYLLFLEKKDIENMEIKIQLTNQEITKELELAIGNIENNPIEEIEVKLQEYINQRVSEDEKEVVSEENTDNEMSVEFNMKWVKEMNRKLQW